MVQMWRLLLFVRGESCGNPPSVGPIVRTDSCSGRIPLTVRLYEQMADAVAAKVERCPARR